MAQGHRERLKRRFLNEGLENFEPHNVLELLLFYAIPRIDTNPIAHRLMDRFGSLSEVFNASVSELCSVEGIGENAAVFLKLMGESLKYCQSDTEKTDRMTFDQEKRIGKYLIGKYRGLQNEVVFLLIFDGKRRLIETYKVYEGSVSSAGVNIRRMAQIALENRAVAVILAHNHPGGIAFPSSDDLLVTASLKKALMLLDIDLVAHYIIAEESYIKLDSELKTTDNPSLSTFK